IAHEIARVRRMKALPRRLVSPHADDAARMGKVRIHAVGTTARRMGPTEGVPELVNGRLGRGVSRKAEADATTREIVGRRLPQIREPQDAALSAKLAEAVGRLDDAVIVMVG